MYNHQLDTFLTAAREGSFSKAASALFISPSAVIQQINSLEENLKTTLFIRSRHGITLTEAGRYLAAQAPQLVEISTQIRAGLDKISREGNAICFGTSMDEKIRLLFDLWMLYQKDRPDQAVPEIRIESIDTEKGQLRDAQLVEDVFAERKWQRNWEFQKICDVPVVCAMDKFHPLLVKKEITFSDLNPYTVVISSRGDSQAAARLIRQLSQKGITVRPVSSLNGKVIWNASVHNEVILVSSCKSDVLVDLESRRLAGAPIVPYGVFYRKDIPPQTAQFLSFIRSVYDGTAHVDMVPVF